MGFSKMFMHDYGGGAGGWPYDIGRAFLAYLSVPPL